MNGRCGKTKETARDNQIQSGGKEVSEKEQTIYRCRVEQAYVLHVWRTSSPQSAWRAAGLRTRYRGPPIPTAYGGGHGHGVPENPMFQGENPTPVCPVVSILGKACARPLLLRPLLRPLDIRRLGGALDRVAGR